MQTAYVEEQKKLLQQQIAELEKQQNDLDRKSREAQSEAWKVIHGNKDNYEWRVEVKEDLDWCNGEIKKITHGVKVEQRIKPEVLAEWKKGGFSTFSSDLQKEDRWFGMFYYRTDENILYHKGGGYSILNDVKLCNDEEWALIVANKIPSKFIR